MTRKRTYRQMILLMAFFLTTAMWAGNQKHALLVGISKYQKGTDWRNISGANDVDLLMPVLQKKGFAVKALRDAQATHKNIISSLSSLISKAGKGDVVYLHFSGHGQAVEDRNNDEKDGWDEAFIPYDAKKSPSKSYKGQNHLLDDELGKYITLLRKKLGSKGMVYVVIDACHSGSMDREVFPPVRGTNDAFTFTNKEYRVKYGTGTRYPIARNAKYSKIIMLEACGEEETNQEVREGDKYFGPLSLAVYKTVSSSGFKASKSWVDAIRAYMNRRLRDIHKQRMIEQVDI